MIAGTGGPDGTIDNPLRGTSGADVIYTFPGHDVVAADRGDDMIYSSAGDKIIDGGPGTDFVNYRPEDGMTTQELALLNSGGGGSAAYILPIDKLDVEINTIDNETVMSIDNAGFESRMLWFKLGEAISTDVTQNVEGYLGSDVVDTVNLNGTNTDLYLDGVLEMKIHSARASRPRP